MSQVIAVFGAGTGLGASVARRFGREGFSVALIGRRAARLDALVETLAAENIEAEAFVGDLYDPSAAAPLVRRIVERFGPIDVVEYGPVSTDLGFHPASALTADILEPLTRLFFLTPVEVVRAVRATMIERGTGTILITHGSTAIDPLPGLSGFGPVMAATRNYMQSLHAELGAHGVYVGTLAVGASIRRSEMYEQAAQSRQDSVDTDAFAFPEVDPAVLADIYWQMHVERSTVETRYP